MLDTGWIKGGLLPGIEQPASSITQRATMEYYLTQAFDFRLSFVRFR
jgi:hypothetical protein